MLGTEAHVASRSRSPLKFFLLVFALSVPFLLIGAATEVQLSRDLPVSALIFLVPVIAASILVYREDGAAAVTELLQRSFDYRRIGSRAWYGPIVLLVPGVYALTYVVMRVMGLPLPSVQFPLLAGLGASLVYFIAAMCEELGWMGYAIDPMQERWSALYASILLGLVWSPFHLVPLLQHGRSLVWIAWWSLSTMSLRVLFVWIYNSTGKSVFAVAVTHALTNLSNVGPFLDFGPGGYPYDAQRISALIVTFAAAIVAITWGHKRWFGTEGVAGSPAPQRVSDPSTRAVREGSDAPLSSR